MKKLTLIMMSFVVATSMMAQGMVFEPEGTTLEQASAKAKAEKKLIFLDCFTTWCGPCKKMAREVFPTEVAGAYMNPKFVNLKIDMEGEYGAPLAKKLQIQAYPTFVIFNADAQEIGRLLGYMEASEFIKKVEEKSRDNSSSTLEERWKNGNRDPQFLKEYLGTLNAAYKADDGNDVAEALLAGKESTFASDPELCKIFMRNINNPFAESFKYTAKHPEALKTAVGANAVDMKISNVLRNYQGKLIKEQDGNVSLDQERFDLDQERFDAFNQLMKELNVEEADHFRLSTLITCAEKQKNFDAYMNYVKEYLATPGLDADDMQLANWVKPFADPSTDPKYKAQMKEILKARVADIKAGKRQPMTTIGNMRLSRPTDELLEMLIDAMDGKMPGGH